MMLRPLVTSIVFIVFMATIGHAQVTDTDGDGLLDLSDLPNFNADAAGHLRYAGQVEDLDGASQLVMAITLDLSANRIRQIEKVDFQGLTNLKTLDLSYNQIASIQTQGFEGLTNLERLGLYENPLALERGIFDGLVSLKDLIVGGKHVDRIEAGTFEGLDDLESLSIWDSNIRNIDGDDFQGLANLIELDLYANPIASIESGDFSRLLSLERLNIASAGRMLISNRAFQGLSNLNSLGLSSDPFLDIDSAYHIECGAFTNLPNLKVLSFETPGEFLSFDDGAFQGLSGLEEMYGGFTTLNFTGATFESLRACNTQVFGGSFKVTSGFCVSAPKLTLNDARLSRASFNAIVYERPSEVSLDGMTFTDGYPSNLDGLLHSRSLTTLVVDVHLYEMYAEELDAFSNKEGKVLTVVAPDCNEDEMLDKNDLYCIANEHERDHVLNALGIMPGDLDGDGQVAFDDFLKLSNNFGTDTASYVQGNVNLTNGVDFDDFLILGSNFGKLPGEVKVVPEPCNFRWLLLLFVLGQRFRYQRKHAFNRRRCSYRPGRWRRCLIRCFSVVGHLMVSV